MELEPIKLQLHKGKVDFFAHVMKFSYLDYIKTPSKGKWPRISTLRNTEWQKEIGHDNLERSRNSSNKKDDV